MQQRSLWEVQQIITDKAQIKAYLMLCLAILRDGEILLNAGQPHNGGRMK